MPDCKLCSMKPKYTLDPYTGEKEYTGDWDNEYMLSGEHTWTSIYSGVDARGRIRITASGDDRADYYPKFCPECGRRLEEQDGD